MDLEELKTVSEIIQSWFSSFGIVLGGAWVLWRFVLQREAHPRIEFGVELSVLGRVGDEWLVNVIATITNRGTVRHFLRNFWFVVNHLSAQEKIRFGGAEIDRQVRFRESTRRCYWIEADTKKYFIDSGVTQKYTHVTTVPVDTNFILIYGRFKYPGLFTKYQSVQQAFALPSPASETTVSHGPKCRLILPILLGFVGGAFARALSHPA